MGWDEDFSCPCAQSRAQSPGPALQTRREEFIQHSKHDRNLVYQQSSVRLSWCLRCISAPFKHGCFTAPWSARVVFVPLYRDFWGLIFRSCSQALFSGSENTIAGKIRFSFHILLQLFAARVTHSFENVGGVFSETFQSERCHNSALKWSTNTPKPAVTRDGLRFPPLLPHPAWNHLSPSWWQLPVMEMSQQLVTNLLQPLC